jgi:hypothetical protein
MIKAGLVEQEEREEASLDFYLASVALLLGQAATSRFITSDKTVDKALKHIKQTVEERKRVHKKA